MMASAANVLELWKGLNKAVDFIYILKIWLFLTDFPSLMKVFFIENFKVLSSKEGWNKAKLKYIITYKSLSVLFMCVSYKKKS